MNPLETIPKRWLNLGGFAICAALLGYAYFLQFQQGLEPCPLCIFQRVAFIALGLAFLAAGLHHPGQLGSRVYGVIIATAAFTGAAIAGRQVWLQHLPPDRIPDCGPGLDYMLEVFPLSQALRMVFTGSGECAEVVWTFLGLSTPSWSLICFLGLGILGLARNWVSR